jgi:hypothetical protein
MVTDIDIKWARFVSDIVSPPVVWGIFSIVLAFYEAETLSQAVLWSLVYVLLVCILPVIFIVVRVRQGKITDIHMPLRRERFLPFIVTLIGALIAAVLLYLLPAARPVQLLSIATIIQVTLMAVITLYWQISIHMICISGVVVLVGMWFGPFYGGLLSPLVLIVGMARLVLKRHNMRQVIIGALVGSISIATFFAAVG